MPSQFTTASPGTSLSSGTTANVLSQSIQAGSYLVWGQVNFALSAATATEIDVGISLTSAALPSQQGGGGLGPDPLFVSPLLVTLLTATESLRCGPVILILSNSATVYLCAKMVFSVGSCSVYGTLTILPIAGSGFNLMSS